MLSQRFLRLGGEEMLSVIQEEADASP